MDRCNDYSMGSEVAYGDSTNPHGRGYEAALAEIESLWGASYGSPEGDRFDVLVTLVEANEQKHYPIEPPDPIKETRIRWRAKG